MGKIIHTVYTYKTDFGPVAVDDVDPELRDMLMTAPTRIDGRRLDMRYRKSKDAHKAATDIAYTAWASNTKYNRP